MPEHHNRFTALSSFIPFLCSNLVKSVVNLKVVSMNIRYFLQLIAICAGSLASIANAASFNYINSCTPNNPDTDYADQGDGTVLHE